MIKKTFFLLSFLLVLITVTPPVDAAFSILQPANGGVKVTNQTGEQLVQTIVGNVLVVLFTVAGIGAVIMFLWGAIEWITSGGDKEKVGKARSKIVNAIIGLVLLALAFVIIRVVGQVIGFNPLGNLTLPVLGTPTGSGSGSGDGSVLEP